MKMDRLKSVSGLLLWNCLMLDWLIMDCLIMD
jgi:hypothetical protein